MKAIILVLIAMNNFRGNDRFSSKSNVNSKERKKHNLTLYWKSEFISNTTALTITTISHDCIGRFQFQMQTFHTRKMLIIIYALITSQALNIFVFLLSRQQFNWFVLFHFEKKN